MAPSWQDALLPVSQQNDNTDILALVSSNIKMLLLITSVFYSQLQIQKVVKLNLYKHITSLGVGLVLALLPPSPPDPLQGALRAGPDRAALGRESSQSMRCPRSGPLFQDGPREFEGWEGVG